MDSMIDGSLAVSGILEGVLVTVSALNGVRATPSGGLGEGNFRAEESSLRGDGGGGEASPSPPYKFHSWKRDRAAAGSSG